MSSHFRPCSTQREDALNEPNLVDEGLDLLGGDDRPLPNLGQVVIIVGDVTVDLLCASRRWRKSLPSGGHVGREC